MARLIDADALLEYLDKRRIYEVMDGRNKAYGKGVRDAMKDIESASTIDAIPVAWIQQFCKDDISEDDQIAIGWMLGVWQKEQEAR